MKSSTPQTLIIHTEHGTSPHHIVSSNQGQERDTSPVAFPFPALLRQQAPKKGKHLATAPGEFLSLPERKFPRAAN